ncbi:MAG TPA: oxygenase MpaB family protein [Caulobacteraceae bacterium]|nr:oxygenase MpaB family protein [Caulobacteraceae bacterium]
MNPSSIDFAGSAARQAAELPAMYGKVDFTDTPERFTTDPDAQTALGADLGERQRLLADTKTVATVRAYTMTGDAAADAYAALIPTLGFQRLVAMLDEACDKGVEAVADAPAELVRLLQEMDRFPDWLDRRLVEEGARLERNAYAHRAPYAIRGGLLGTYMNKYSALPMALTGALSNATAARRVRETASFFTTVVMPGALDRHGAGFKAAAKVRLMHSMVRFNVLSRGERWDSKVYGVPIPQIDQLPAGLISIPVVARKALRRPGKAFTPAERARVELARCRCWLLGLPQALLPDTPQGIVDLVATRRATLRKSFDETCAGLVRATLEADLTGDHSLGGVVHAWLERGFTKASFVAGALHGDRRAAEAVGVRMTFADVAGAATATLLIALRMAPFALAARIPALSRIADRALVRDVARQLAAYGHPEFTTDAHRYRPAAAAVAH